LNGNDLKLKEIEVEDSENESGDMTP